MESFDLRRLFLRPGEVRREHVDVELEPFLLGGQRYEVSPALVPVVLDITRASGATIFDIHLDAHLSGPCMRCLAFAELDLDVSAREVDDPDSPRGDELRSDYVVDEQLLVGTWVRDAIALGIPDRVLCRPDCAGLCPVCGKDLNIEPHEHVDTTTDPRWAALEQLRDEG
ncbi:MAG: DUF177 domain-containing protein [Acidimicrobiia bacterium]